MKRHLTSFLLLLATGLLFSTADLGAAPEAAKGKEKDAKETKSMQTYTGTLKTGVMAIGAETTGYTLTTATNEVYELEFKNPKLKAQADQMDGKSITVEGIYRPRPGVEVKERRIIEVKKLSAAS